MKPEFKPLARKLVAGVAVLAALASVVAGREKPSSVDAVVQPASLRSKAHVEEETLDLSRLEARAGEGAKADAFAPRNFAPIVPPAPPAKPSAPPLPFRYLGKMVEDGKPSVFLERGGESLTVAAGERVGDYRVDQITEAEIRFTYLPLKTRQTLPL